MFRSNKLKTFFAEEGSEHFDYNSLNKRVHKKDVDKVVEAFKLHVNNGSDFIDATYQFNRA